MTALLLVARTLSAHLRAPTVPDPEMRRVLDEILITRDSWRIALAGLITSRELVDLVIAHMITAIVRNSGGAVPEQAVQDAALLEAVRVACGIERTDG
jgi:hypothetical protein